MTLEKIIERVWFGLICYTTITILNQTISLIKKQITNSFSELLVIIISIQISFGVLYLIGCFDDKYFRKEDKNEAK